MAKNNLTFREKAKPYLIMSLDICDKEFLVLFGPAGAGKTTLLKVIAGLIKPDEGDILFAGKPINHVQPRKRNVSMVFENYALYPHLSVYENIASPLRSKLYKKSDAEIDEAVHNITQTMHINHLLERKPYALSNGQRQRVALGRSLVRNPNIFLLDEPLAHLDAKLRHLMRAELKEIQSQFDTTSLYVTHDQLEAMSLSDRIAVIKDGILQQFDTPMNIFHNPANEFIAAFIGDPPMNIMDATIQKTSSGFQFSIQAEEPIHIPVPAQFYPVIYDGMKIRLGIRPTEILIDDDLNAESTAISVAAYEDLGDEHHLHFRLKEQYLTLITQNPKEFHPGESVKLSFKAKSTLIFDVNTGKRIYGKDK